MLVIAPHWVGDAILSLPLIAALAKSRKTVDVLATPAVAAIYDYAGTVNRVITEPFEHGKLQWAKRRAVARELRNTYGLAVVLPNSIKSALIAWMAKIAVRRGLLGEHRYLLLNDRRDAPKTGRQGRPSMLASYMALADFPDADSAIDPMGRHRPRLFVRNDARKDPAIPADARETLMVLCPGAEYGPAKQWPAEKFVHVAKDWLGRNPGYRVAILGSPKEKPLGEKIKQLLCANMQSPDVALRIDQQCGATTLYQALAWIASARIVVSNDSGLMHAAAAFDVPVVAIFGSTDPHHTPPHSPQAVVLSLGLSCSPCFKRVCPLGTTACLADLPPARAIDAVSQLTRPQ